MNDACGLRLSGRVRVADDADQLYDGLGHALMEAGQQAVVDRGVFHLALSGGSTPERFYVRLVTDPRFRAIPWGQTHLWIVDERRVAQDDQRCNYRMIQQSLANHIPVKSNQLHPMPVLEDDPAGKYEAELLHAFGMQAGAKPRLDFVLLGMGGDGHTASLFPHSDALGESERLVVVNDGPNVTPPARVTMTYPLLNAARQIAVLVTGAKKTAMLKQIDQQLCEHGPDPKTLPITGIKPDQGKLAWYLDRAAAGADQ